MSGHTLLPAEAITLPLLPLRDVVVFPHMVIPLFVGRAKSVRALEEAMSTVKRIVLLTQKNAANEGALTTDDLYQEGVIGNVLQMLKLPDGTVKVLMEGLQRAKVLRIEALEDMYNAQVLPHHASDEAGLSTKQKAKVSVQVDGLRRTVIEQFSNYTKLSRRIPQEIMNSIVSLDDPSRVADTIASHIPLKLERKQRILDITNIKDRLQELSLQLEGEISVLNVDKKIRGQVKKAFDKHQREHYLHEQAKAIQKELSEGEDGVDLDDLAKKIKRAKMPKAAEKKALNEQAKLKAMSPMSSEATVIRNYIDVLVGLPWSKATKIANDLSAAQKILDEDHYGLDKVKERILEYLAVQARVGKLKAPILCLVGPPGVGKTSLGQSVARATGRKYVRMALGGMRDEAEIRGHRRTYIGALPGKVLQNLAKVETRNPLFLLDEIDKMGSDHRGDPSSALLEVLDPEQNHTFGDHYVELDFDLSDVMFVATSNSLNIPAALLDRMEVIHLSGYTEDEKINIALHHLLPKQLTNNGVKPTELEITQAAIQNIVRYYTREAGVRNLERDLSKICRKVVKGLQLQQYTSRVTVDADNLSDFLGVRKFKFGQAEKANQVGQVVGLVWTEVGGDLLTIETAVMPGKGNITRTGSLGDVMKESVEAARTVVRSRANRLGISDQAFENKDLHIHVPDGATPKDGPSAGAAMTLSLVSALTGIPVKADVAMTGEITLRGEVTAIGGLKEKLLAALRGGIHTVLIPEDNVKDLADIPDNVKNNLDIVPVRWIDQVLQAALEYMPKAIAQETDIAIKLKKAAPPSKAMLSKGGTPIVVPPSSTKH